MIFYICSSITDNFDCQLVTCSEREAYEHLYSQMEMLADEVWESMNLSECYDLNGEEIDYSEFLKQYKDSKDDQTWIEHFTEQIHEMLTVDDRGYFSFYKINFFEDFLNNYIDINKLPENIKQKISVYKKMQCEIIDDLNDYWE